MKKDNVFWGVLLVLAAVYIIINNLGFMPDVNVVRLGLAVVCVAIFIKSLARLEFGGMLFSLAVLAILFDRQLGITSLTPWPVLMAALFGSIGLNMIFGGSGRHRPEKKSDWDLKGREYVSGEEIYIQGRFNGYKKTISSDNFTRAKISCKFGGMEISFDDAIIQSGTAIVELDVSFSGIELYIPQSWRVVNETDGTFGGFDEHRAHSAESGPTIVFRGKIRFGGVEIYRI